MNILHCSRNILSRASPYYLKQKYDSLRHQNRSLIFCSKIIFRSWLPTFLLSWITAAAVESNQGWVSAGLRILDTHHIHRLRRAELPRGWASPTKPNQHTFATRLDTHLSCFQSQSEGTSRFQDLYNELLLARGKVGQGGQWPLYGILKWSSL